ncbi:hypothetical protein CLF_110850 [Clonorchis sinensis]|uniref:Uncharacterized protein n=1 Tax=Clonorchis sinensis TaxID=79923 RepID=G7YTZ2_CLOSI|nr:hypothetical protein CLF_110850 [Clonorchis sinensis]
MRHRFVESCADCNIVNYSVQNGLHLIGLHRIWTNLDEGAVVPGSIRKKHNKLLTTSDRRELNVSNNSPLVCGITSNTYRDVDCSIPTEDKGATCLYEPMVVSFDKKVSGSESCFGAAVTGYAKTLGVRFFQLVSLNTEKQRTLAMCDLRLDGLARTRERYSTGDDFMSVIKRESTPRVIHNDVSQRSVSRPTLTFVYIEDLLANIQPPYSVYEDDFKA